MKFSPLGLSSMLAMASFAGAELAKRDDTTDTYIVEIVKGLANATTCAGCEALLVILQGLADLGDDAFSDTIIELCILGKIEDSDVCTGSISREGPILAHDLREMIIPSHTAQLFCTTIFGLCPFPDVTPYEVVFPSPKPAQTSRPAVSGKTPVEIVQYSDIHVDLSYETGSSYSCTKPICCRPYTSADAPGNTSYPAGPYGEHECDAPASLEESMYAAIKEIAPDAILTLFTGDVAERAVWLVDETEVTGDLESAYGKMDGLPSVYGTVGNHEAAPVNSFPPVAVNTNISSQWVYDTLSGLWESTIGSVAAASADTNPGAYSVLYPDSKLRIISFNTNMYYKENFWLFETVMETDPSGQLAWLVNELQAAEDACERVYLIGHMPMGCGDALHDGSNYFDQIVNRYEGVIAALFFGHTHDDEFEISYSDYTAQSASTAVAVSYIAPAMTPSSGMPAFRVYSVDPDTFAVLDVTTYMANMSDPTYQTSGPTWTKYYSAREAYGALVTPALTDNATSELSPAFWHNVTEVLSANQTAFDEYYARKTRGYNVSACTGTCVTDEVCQLRAAQSQYNCATVTPGISFKAKRSDGHAAYGHARAHAHKDGSCESSGFKRLIRGLQAQGTTDILRERRRTMSRQRV